MTFKSKSLIEVQNLACCPKSSVYVDGEGVADLIVLTVSFFCMQNYLVSTWNGKWLEVQYVTCQVY